MAVSLAGPRGKRRSDGRGEGLLGGGSNRSPEWTPASLPLVKFRVERPPPRLWRQRRVLWPLQLQQVQQLHGGLPPLDVESAEGGAGGGEEGRVRGTPTGKTGMGPDESSSDRSRHLPGNVHVRHVARLRTRQPAPSGPPALAGGGGGVPRSSKNVPGVFSPVHPLRSARRRRPKCRSRAEVRRGPGRGAGADNRAR